MSLKNPMTPPGIDPGTARHLIVLGDNIYSHNLKYEFLSLMMMTIIRATAGFS
jgi:hypothetical protein